MPEDSTLIIQQQCLEACFNLPSYDYKIERVHQETSQLFASKELRQRLQEKARRIV